MQAWRSTDAGRGHRAFPDLPRAGAAGDDRPLADNARVLRYLAKVTVEPTNRPRRRRARRVARPGRLADIVL